MPIEVVAFRAGEHRVVELPPRHRAVQHGRREQRVERGGRGAFGRRHHAAVDAEQAG